MDKLLIELHNHRSSGLIKEHQEDNDTIVRRSLSEFGVMLDGIFTFGAGITAFLPMVRDLINNEMPHIDETTIPLLYIVAIWSITGRHLDLVRKLTSILKERGLLETLSSVIRFLKSVEDVSLKVAKEVGHAASDIADIGAFTFLMFPIMDGILYLINEGSITLGDPAGYLKSVLIGIGVIGIKNIFNSIISKIRFRLRNERMDESILKTVDDRGVSSDVIKVIKSTMFRNNSSSWVLPECVGGDVYTIGGTDYTIDLTVSRDVSLRNKTHLIEVRSLDNTIILDVTINPHKEHIVYRKIKNTIRECIWRFDNVNGGLLNEQELKKYMADTTSGNNRPIRVREVYNDDEVKVVVPLDRDTFCKLAEDTKWCSHGEYNRETPHVDVVRKGTPYIHINKKDGTKHLLGGHSKIPFYDLNSDEPGSLNIWDANIHRVNSRKFLSTNKELSKLFNIEYTLKERIKYDIPLTSEELNLYAKTNKFTEAINKVRLNYNEETEEGLYEFKSFPPDKDNPNWVISSNDSNQRWRDYDKIYVDIKPFGVELSVPIQEFVDSWMALSEDETWIFHDAFDVTSYGGYADHVDADELNYIDSYITATSVERFRELTKLFGKGMRGDIAGDEINDFLNKNYKDEWSRVSDELIYTMSQGVEAHKKNEMEEFFRDESIFELTVGDREVNFFITWDTLLFLCYIHGIKSFEGLGEVDIDQVEGVYDTYSDAWGVDDNYREEIDTDFRTMIDDLIDNFTPDYKDNMAHYHNTIETLGFKEYGYQGSKVLTTPEKHIYIDSFNPHKNTVDIRVTPVNVGYTSQVKYKHIVDIDDLVNYVQSNELELDFENGDETYHEPNTVSAPASSYLETPTD